VPPKSPRPFACALLLAAAAASTSARAEAQDAQDARTPDAAPAPAPAPAPDPISPPASIPPPTLDPTATPRVRLRSNLAVDLTVTGVLAASLVTWAVAIKPNLSAPSCTICDGPNGKVNGVDDFFRTTFKLDPSSPAGTISDVFGYGVSPLTGVAFAIALPVRDGRGDEAAENVLLVTEATLTYAVLQQSLTAIFPRERPKEHAEPSPDHELAVQRHSALESFPGGHNGLGFVVAAAGGTIATLRGYRLAPLVWIVGGTLALVTTYLRMAADRHYFTDLTVGAALGIGTGIAIPLLFHRPIDSRERTTGVTRWMHGGMISTTEVPGGRVVRVGWTF
jgi:membrane-associated phospholipid phosphatase